MDGELELIELYVEHSTYATVAREDDSTVRLVPPPIVDAEVETVYTPRVFLAKDRDRANSISGDRVFNGIGEGGLVSESDDLAIVGDEGAGRVGIQGESFFKVVKTARMIWKSEETGGAR